METNKVFELVEYLYSERRELATYKRVIDKVRRLRNEVDSLKPKSPLSDDTLYNRKQKELDEYVACSKVDKFTDNHRNKISELGFTLNSIKTTELGYTIRWRSYRQEFKNVIDNWADNATDKVEARKQLAECKRQYNELQTEEVQFVLDWIGGEFFYVLNDELKETFDRHLGKKYNDLSSDLKPFLEHFDADVIESIIDYKRLPQGAEKPIWKRQADAHRFSKHFNIDTKDMNKMFLFRDSKGNLKDNLRPNSESKSSNSEFSDVLSKYN
ncbi:MAG: hypothetical protein PHS04_14835 [Tissierellia bacterium]|nr:hypothetical protein [Tissierellia bacterium]